MVRQSAAASQTAPPTSGARTSKAVARLVTVAALSFVALAAALTAPATASAQTAAILPIVGDEAGRRAESAAVEEITAALRAGGYAKVIPPQALLDRVGEGARCDSLSCAAELLDALDLELAVLAAVYLEGPQPQVTIGTTSVSGHEAESIESLSRAELRPIIRETTASVLTTLGKDSAVVLRITGTPLRATVFLNREAVGTLPATIPLDPGEHEILVSMDGYADYHENVVVGPRSRVLTVHLEEPSAATEPDVTVDVSAVSTLNYILGAGLATGGLALVIPSAISAIKNGQCVNGCEPIDATGAYYQYRFGIRSAILGGLGLVALGASAYFFIARPIRIHVSVAPDAAALELHGTF